MEASCTGGIFAFDPCAYEIARAFDLVDPKVLIAEYHSNSRFKPCDAPYANHHLENFHLEADLILYWREYIDPVVEADVPATATDAADEPRPSDQAIRPTANSHAS